MKRKLPKIVLAPMNVASMPVQIVDELKARGYDAEQVQYTFGQGHKFGYKLDREVNIRELGGRIKAHAKIAREYLERDFDIFHFWNKSFFFEGKYNHMTGFDIPLIKARGKRIAYRFTGFDIRLPSWDLEVNPHSPFRYGYEHPFNEPVQKYYLKFLEEYVDQFLVQDPEMEQFSPKPAHIIPRALDLKNWTNVGISKSDCPLVVHAPSNNIYKGTKFVLEAVDQLRQEGLVFEFKAISGMKHEEAVSWYKRADIIVDQLLIGATGVLTLEAWALGKPCVVNLREDLFKPFYKTSELPVANANPDNITEVLRKLIKDYEWRKELSKRGRETVEQFHDVNKVIDQYIDLYDGMMRKRPKKPKGYGDIDYLRLQAEMSQKSVLIIKNKDRKLAEITGSQQTMTVTASDVVQEMDGDEKIQILDAMFPKIIVWPIRMLVYGRRRVLIAKGGIVGVFHKVQARFKGR